MKKPLAYLLLTLLFLGLSSMAVHKFYVSIYQINFVPQKKMVQITARIFIDDLNDGLQHHFSKKTHIGESTETPAEIDLLKQYFAENLSIKINGQQKQIGFLSKELEGNVVICYFSIRDISKVNLLEIHNTALMEISPEQQNIIQTTLNGKKHSLLLTADNVNGSVKSE